MMKSTTWLIAGIVAASVMVGCNSESSAPTAQDDAFAKQLSDAAAKNPGTAAPAGKRGAIPEEALKGPSGAKKKDPSDSK